MAALTPSAEYSFHATAVADAKMRQT